MKKKTDHERLALRRERLRHLAVEDLSRASGGVEILGPLLDALRFGGGGGKCRVSAVEQ